MICCMIRSVLVVDDDAEFRKLVMRLLTASGLTVVGEADSVAAALADAGRLKPSAFLVDVELPDGDGLTLARALAALPWRPRVVLTSIDGDITTSDEARNAGALAFVNKPDLPNAPVAWLLGERRRRNDLRASSRPYPDKPSCAPILQPPTPRRRPQMSPTPDYFDRYENFALTRSESGVLTLRFHTAGGPVTFTGATHSDFPRVLEAIAFDRNNKVLVITGTGDRFMTEIDGASLGDITKPMASDITYMEGRRIPQRLADLEMPIIAAVNGPASVHSEYALIADIVIASETTEFSDFPHLTFGINPGDGLHIVWEEALGLNRARYYALTQGTFTAAEAKQWGAVAEVLPQDQVLARAQELAESLAAKPQLLTRYAAVTLRQRISRRMAEGTALGMALESLTAANLAYLPQPQ
jgi:enoyl-CoA hydratase/carnithine racemase/ActR/RegA family two-component response regulator